MDRGGVTRRAVGAVAAVAAFLVLLGSAVTLALARQDWGDGRATTAGDLLPATLLGVLCAVAGAAALRLLTGVGRAAAIGYLAVGLVVLAAALVIG